MSPSRDVSWLVRSASDAGRLSDFLSSAAIVIASYGLMCSSFLYRRLSGSGFSKTWRFSVVDGLALFIVGANGAFPRISA